jgi:hypothetical protein
MDEADCYWRGPIQLACISSRTERVVDRPGRGTLGALAPVVRNVEGVVEMVLDATANFSVPLSAKRLFGWHAALFPMGYSGLTRIRVGAWRDDATGPMQVVSGPDHRRKVHYEGPGAGELKQVMPRFFNWANATASEPALIKAGLAHLWFVTRLPFDDGNGRIARARDQRAIHAGYRAGQGAFLGALGANAVERTPGQVVEQAA